MATIAATLLRTARNASRAAPAAATRAAATMASRSARAAGVAAAASPAARLDSGVTSPDLKSCPTGDDDDSTKLRDDAKKLRALRAQQRFTSSRADYYTRLSDDGIIPMDKDMESDEAVWALYERWCKTFNRKYNPVEMVRRFKIFKHYAQHVHKCNTYVPEDPKTADVYRRKRRQIDSLLLKGKDASHIHEQYQPLELDVNADGHHPFLNEYDEDLLKQIEESEL